MDRFDSQNRKTESKVTNALISVPWARFSTWLECVCVVTFDLELGQAIELIYPNDAKLTEKEKTSICYLAFPDSFSGCLGDTQFSFRLRQSVGRVSGMWFGDKDAYNREAPLTLQSLVLVSRLPYVYLFQSLLQIIAPEYFEKSEPCLEAVCNEIDQWPPPVPGQTLSLPVMGVILQVRIPSKEDKPGGSPSRQGPKENHLSSPMVFPTIHELDLFKCFQSVLIHIQLLWELTLLGEPLVVMAPSPSVSSETVLSLVSCISPLRYCCDFRPYFTIHDSEFKEYTTRTQAPPNVLLGVTNPFFIKSFQSWPHIMCLGELKMSRDLLKQVKVKKLTKLKTLDTKPGIYTLYKTFIHKDKALIKRLLKGLQRKRPSEVQSAILRRHFLELTQSFIDPLERYVDSLMPLQISMTPWKTPPQIRLFSQDEFLGTLDHAGPQINSMHKGDWLGLYKQFFQSPNFDGWFRAKHREMTHKVECLHLEAICDADLLSWTKDKSEVETVDLILKLREKLMRAHMQQLPVKEELLDKLESYIHSVVSSLPDDLQTVLYKD
ncbi:protein DENND6B isoform X2 [Hemibagrus wyckioides]|uniref:protein DENND6B isoform X2 n=1 Tax=Hemibagrus wyckioides TaxID=337641 RepID=UPI00266CC035|nr:protein DENND6B isoform X2 [Hemibagrus wyckioides]